MFDWDDIRLFLVVAQEGSTLGASKRLNINQTTVSRRIQALEHALKLTLFERDPRGYAVTPHGSALLDLAGQMAATGIFGDHLLEGPRRRVNLCVIS